MWWERRVDISQEQWSTGEWFKCVVEMRKEGESGKVENTGGKISIDRME